MSVGYHLTFRLRDNRVMAPTVRARRRIARSFLEIGDVSGLLAFRIAADHGHALVVCDRPAAGRTAQAIGSSITQALGLPEGFNITHIKPVADQRHLEAAFDYVLGQAEHHGLSDDPLHDGSALPDLLGLRVLGTGLEARVCTWLPRATATTVRRHLGIVPSAMTFAAQHLADAAAAAFALPDLAGKSRRHGLARAAAARLALGHLRTEAVAEILGCSPASVNRARAVEVPDALTLAIRKGMTLRAALGDRLTPRLARPPERAQPRA